MKLRRYNATGTQRGRTRDRLSQYFSLHSPDEEFSTKKKSFWGFAFPSLLLWRRRSNFACEIHLKKMNLVMKLAPALEGKCKGWKSHLRRCHQSSA